MEDTAPYGTEPDDTVPEGSAPGRTTPFGDGGTVTVVTGAARGIGAAVARTLAARGAVIAVIDRDAVGAADVAARMARAGHRSAAYPADVSDSTAVESAMTAIERELGPIGALVNAAGVLAPAPVTALTDESWAGTLAVNASGVMHCSRAAARRMAGRRAGAIVTVASNAGRTPRTGMAAYSASKAAAAAFTRCLGLELAPLGIRCNVVSPGSTDTDMQRALWADDEGARGVIAGDPGTFRLGIPLGRLADPRDIAEAVAFLLSPQARQITMHDLCVDGGATLGA